MGFASNGKKCQINIVLSYAGLLSMAVAQVCDMLKILNLDEYIHVIEKESVDGAMLSFLNMEGLAQLGITNVLHAAKILGQVAKLKHDF